MEAWQERVIAEKRELDEKIARLSEFIASNPTFDALPMQDKGLMNSQLLAMRSYSVALDFRIKRFN